MQFLYKSKGKTMKCIICNSNNVGYYFTTEFEGENAKLLDKSIYHRCKNCGFTFSKTLFDMDYSTWSKLNIETHTYWELMSKNDLNYRLQNSGTNQPPYLAQADMVNLMIKNNIIETNTNGGGGSRSKSSHLC